MTVEGRCRDGAPVVGPLLPTHAALTVLCGAGAADRGLAGDRGGIVGGAVLGRQVLVDGQFPGEAFIDGAQSLDRRIDGVTIIFEAGDLVVELGNQASHDLKLGHGLWGMLFGSLCGAAAGGQSQRLPAEQSDCHGCGLLTEGGTQPQPGAGHRGLLVAAAANFGQCVGGGAAAARHFLFGQVQLRDPLIDEVDEPGRPVGWNCRTRATTAPNTPYLAPDFRHGFASHPTDRFAACRY